MGFEPLADVEDEDAGAFRDCMQESLEEAKAALVKAKEEYVQYYNRCRKPTLVFGTGDMVLLDASDIKMNRLNAKFAALRLNPFKILEAVGKGAYRLKLPPSLHRLHPVFLVVKLFLMPADPFLTRRAAAARAAPAA